MKNWPISKEKIEAAIKLIEEKSVYRCQTLCDDGSAMFTSTNGMPTMRWTAKEIVELAEIVKNKPEGI